AQAQNTSAQNTSAQNPASRYIVYCGTLIDGVSAQPRKEVRIEIEGNRIARMQFQPMPEGFSATPPEGRAYFIDLSHETWRPGLIDVHTHVLLQGDIIVDYDEQLLKESTAYRTIRATVAARRGLEF